MGNNIPTDLSKALLAEINQEQSQLPKIRQYLYEGADINYQAEEDGYTALMLAVDKDDEPLVTYLLQLGADPLIQNKYQEIASDLALTYSPIYQFLKNYELLFATLHNDVASVKAILATGANINFQGQGGYTAIIIAVEQKLLELVEFLIVSGADLSLENNEGWGVYDYAKDVLIYHTIRAGKPLYEDTAP
ncbi:ankyrin repeat domain-containing protein [Legionella drozanskii]|nr:ankyrin repeat domain-containing protein [Legionella drozanskii]